MSWSVHAGDHARVARLAVGWVALSVTIGGGFLLPSLLIVCVLWPGATWPERCAFIAPLVLTSLPLLAAVRVGGRVIAHTRRWSSYPKAHWRRAVQTLWGSLAFMLIGATLATGGTAFAIFGRSSIASPAVWWICFGDVIVFLGFFVSLSEVSCVLNRGQVVPYFERPVGGIDTFCHGQSLLRNLADLERLAEEIGVSPLSAFGWHDDMRGETVVWHDPAVGLKTVKALLTHLGGEDLARPDLAGIMDDLERIAHALERAVAEGCRFSLLLRYSDGTNGQEWEIRQGSCF